MGGQGKDLIFGIFDQPQGVLEGLLYLFWCEDHTKSCAHVNLRDRKKAKDVGVRSETSAVERNIFRALDLRPESQAQDSGQWNRKQTSSGEDDDQRKVNIFASR